MIVVVLRIQGESLQPEGLSWLPRERLERTWRKGESRLGATVNKASGFSLLLSQGDDATHVVAAVAKVLEPLVGFLSHLVEGGAQGEVDFGMMIDADGSAMQSLRLDRALLRLLDQCGIDAVVSTYPCDEQG